MAGGKYSQIVTSWTGFDKKVKEMANVKEVSLREKGYSSELNKRGIKSYFEEIFGVPDSRNGQLLKVPLQDQELPVVGPFEDIRLTTSFQNGRKRGMLLVDNGYTEEMYLTVFLPDFEAKFDQLKHR